MSDLWVSYWKHNWFSPLPIPSAHKTAQQKVALNTYSNLLNTHQDRPQTSPDLNSIQQYVFILNAVISGLFVLTL